MSVSPTPTYSYIPPAVDIGALDKDVRNLSVKVGGIETQLNSLVSSNEALSTKLDVISANIISSRPSINQIWVPLGVLTSILLGLGATLASPYVDKVEENAGRIDRLAERNELFRDRMTRLEIRQAVIADRQVRDHPEFPPLSDY
jgi:hypothetical protein